MSLKHQGFHGEPSPAYEVWATETLGDGNVVEHQFRFESWLEVEKFVESWRTARYKVTLRIFRPESHSQYVMFPNTQGEEK